MRTGVTNQEWAIVEAHLKNSFQIGKTAKELGLSTSLINKRLESYRVRQYMAKRIRQMEKKNQINADTVIEGMAAIAFFNIKEAFKKDDAGMLREIPLDELPDDIAGAIKDMKIINYMITDKEGNKTPAQEFHYTFYDKHKSLEMLGKHFDLFIQKISIDVQQNVLHRLMFASPEEIALIHDKGLDHYKHLIERENVMKDNKPQVLAPMTLESGRI